MIRRTKVSEQVVEHLLGEFLSGRLRPGDRIDLDAVAEELQVSRSPVREALLTLERDQTVRMPFQRGAFWNDIGSAHIREGFTLYALLCGLSARAACQKMSEPAYAQSVERAVDSALQASTARDFEEGAREVRRLVNRVGAGAHLRALLRTFQGLVVAVAAVGVAQDLEEEKALLAAELEALRSGDPQRASEAAMRHIQATGERAIDELSARGVLADHEPEPTDQQLESLQTLLTQVGGAR